MAAAAASRDGGISLVVFFSAFRRRAWQLSHSTTMFGTRFVRAFGRICLPWASLYDQAATGAVALLSALDECNVPHSSHLHGLPELGDTTAHTWVCWDPRFMCFLYSSREFHNNTKRTDQTQTREFHTILREKKRTFRSLLCASYHTFVFTVWCVVSVCQKHAKKETTWI
jgi:hypothetical protein